MEDHKVHIVKEGELLIVEEEVLVDQYKDIT